MILVFGSLNIDLVAKVASIPRPGETVLSPTYVAVPGGKGANQAVATARVTAPGTVVMAGRVGDDAFGRTARENLIANGVDADAVTTCAEATAVAFIAIDAAGENAIVVASGANACLDAASVSDAVMARTRVAVLQMEVPFVESLAVARRARAQGARVIWNLAPAPRDFSARDVAELMGATDILVVNEHEAIVAAALIGAGVGTHKAAGTVLASRGCTTIVTAGAEGATAYSSDGTQAQCPALAIAPVDTTGAGDAFVGILAAGLCEGRTLEEAMARACRGASLACLALGAQSSLPSRTRLDEAMREN